jgi:hypothetical protein
MYCLSVLKTKEPRNKDEPLFLSFFVFNVLATELAIFFQVQSFRIIFLVFHGCVIASFASSTGQCDDDAVVFLRHDNNSKQLSCRQKQDRKKKPPRRRQGKYIQEFEKLSIKLE